MSLSPVRKLRSCLERAYHVDARRDTGLRISSGSSVAGWTILALPLGKLTFTGMRARFGHGA